MTPIKALPFVRRCASTEETHILNLPPCRPVSKNPTEGSTLRISYHPRSLVIEVAALREYVDSYVGGRGDVRSMEDMIQQIAQDSSNSVQTGVTVEADLSLNPNQSMHLKCRAEPK